VRHQGKGWTVSISCVLNGCNGFIVDGHNRYERCEKHGIKYQTTEKDFNSRTDVINWIIDNQLNRRNISGDQRTYLIGKRYQEEKKEVGENQYTETKEDTKRGANSLPPPKTAQKIAEQSKVSHQTVKNAEKFAEAVDKVTENTGIDPQKILSGEIKATSKDIQLNKFIVLSFSISLQIISS